MLVTFRTEAHAGITMFGNIALDMVRMMGHTPTVPGAILAKDIPEALIRLETNLESRKGAPPAGDEDEARDKEDDEPPVSISHRALPLIELLKAAAAADKHVMWEEASFYN